MPRSPPRRGVSGFTLIETLLAVGLAAILATTATPVFIDATNQAQLAGEEAVVGHVQTGITLNQMQNFATTGAADYPPTLDNAPIGVIANGGNPFFHFVLNPSVTTGWRKESELTYRSPTDRLFIYDPETGAFSTTEEIVGSGDGKEKRQPTGNIIFEYADIVFYDSGAIVDRLSDLAYFPNLSDDNVALRLVSGTTIETQGNGSALVTLPQGEVLTVSDLTKMNLFNLSPKDQEQNELVYDFVWAQNQYAGEIKEKITYVKKENKSNAQEGFFDYQYYIEGGDAGGSLTKQVGQIYRNQYSSETPQTTTGSWSRNEKGDLISTTRHTYDYDSASRYGYAKSSIDYRYAFQQDGKTSGWLETTATTTKDNNTHGTQFKGNHQYQVDRDTSNGKWKSKTEYDYDGTTEYDKKNGFYKSETNYHYKNGRDETHHYDYNETDGTYELTIKNNKTGKVRRQSNRP